MTLGIRAASETDTYAFKRFKNNPTLVVTYDTFLAGSDLATTEPATPCTGGAIGSADITLKAIPSDGDGGSVTAQFEYWASGVAVKTVGVPATSGQTARLELKRTLGAALVVLARQDPGQGRQQRSAELPAWTPTCSFTVDLSAPQKSVNVTSPSFGGGNVAGGPAPAGRAATFTIMTDPDVAKVAVRFDRATPVLKVPVTGGKATVTMMTTKLGRSALNVQTFDAAGTPRALTTTTRSSVRCQPISRPRTRATSTATGIRTSCGSTRDSVTCLYAGSGVIDVTTTFSSGNACANLVDVGFAAGTKPVDVRDWDGDTFSDAMTLMPNGQLCLSRGNGVGAFSPAGKCESLVTGDIDPDTLEPRPFTTTFTDIYDAKDWDADVTRRSPARPPTSSCGSSRTMTVVPDVPVNTSGYLLGTGWTPYHVVFPGDITGDGQADIIGRTGQSLYVYIGDKTTADPKVRVKVYEGGGWDQYAQLLDLGNWNRSGPADIAGVGPTGRDVVLPRPRR